MTTRVGKPVQKVHVPARSGGALRMLKGQRLKVIAVQGKQICDFFAFKQANILEYIATGHIRAQTRNLNLGVGSFMYSNRRNKLMVFLEDTVGKHDTMMAACDSTRYLEQGYPDHANCQDNALGALARVGVFPPILPDPVNLFQNTNWNDEGQIETGTSTAEAGGYVLLQALADLIVAVSACPSDLTPGNNYNPTDLMLEVYDG